MNTRDISRSSGQFAHQPPPRADGKLAITITHLEIAPDDWTKRGLTPDIDVRVARELSPTVARLVKGYAAVAASATTRVASPMFIPKSLAMSGSRTRNPLLSNWSVSVRPKRISSGNTSRSTGNTSPARTRSP